MSHWFPSDRRFAFVPLAELADEVNTASPRLLLPTFQRDAVWDEKHVELLWDSLLRDFPIGALLVARPPERASTRQLQLGRGAAAKPSQADAADLVLVDGQQRAIAVALGFRQWSPGDPVRLWIDMANGEEGGAFALRLCTLRYPWGRAARDHHKRAALERLGASALPADEGEWLGQSWPADLTAPVPVAELLASVRPSEAWRALVPKALGSADIPQAQAGHVERVLRALERLRAYELPAVLLEGVESLDDLGKVFERLNTQGVPMSQEDLFFSGLKLHWPDAHDLVWQVYGDEAVGRILAPTKIVHAATRLATNLKMRPKGDVVRLDVKQFSKLVEVRRRDGAAPFIKAIGHFLEPAGPQPAQGRLHEYLRLARGALAYDPGSPCGAADPGLPAPLLARLHWRVWHTLVAWLARGERTVVEPDDRAEMLRYALFDLLAIKRHSDGLTRAPIEVVLAKRAAFPGRALYRRLVRGQEPLVEAGVQQPDAFVAGLEDGAGVPTWSPYPGERLLVMWAQRSFIARCFPQFDPTRYARSEDLPYDGDHILPRALMNRRGRKAPCAKNFWDWRDRLLWSPGNLRYWPRSENRSDRDKSPEKKLLLRARSKPLPKKARLRAKPYELQTYGDVRDASLLPDEDLKHWRKLATGEAGDHDWSDPGRIEAMKTAVLRRRERIYRRFYEEAGFAAWLRRPHESPTGSDTSGGSAR